MSKRTTPASKTTPETPTPRRRATKPAVDHDRRPTRRRRRVPDARPARPTVAVAADASPSTGTPQPSHDEIAIRAYFISIEQGADPLAAWLLAERELTTA